MKPQQLAKLIYLYVGLVAGIALTTFGGVKLAATTVKALSGGYEAVTYPIYPFGPMPIADDGGPITPQQQAEYDKKAQELDRLNAKKGLVSDFATHSSNMAGGLVLLIVFHQLTKRLSS